MNLTGLKEIIKKIIAGDKDYFVHNTAIFPKGMKINFGKRSEINEYVIVRGGSYLKLGEYSQIGPFCVFFTGSGIDIGKNVMIASHCVFAAGNHDYRQIDIPMRYAGSLTKGPIVIEDGVWIGANCTITDGVIIGHDAVVGANSVVTKNVQPFEIVAGVPAKVIGKRK